MGARSVYCLGSQPAVVRCSDTRYRFKDITTGTWSSTSNGPLSNTNRSSAITVGDGYMFLAIDEKIYTRPISLTSTWTLAYSYPVGIDINVLFYDELLVGTSTGLYAQELDLTNVSVQQSIFKNKMQVL